jgi:hypothetical protein
MRTPGVKVTALRGRSPAHRAIYGYGSTTTAGPWSCPATPRCSDNLVEHARGTDLLMHNVGAARPEDLAVSERYLPPHHGPAQRPEKTGECSRR